MKLPACVWIAIAILAGIMSGLSRRHEASATAAVLGERRGRPFQHAAYDVTRRLEGQPGVRFVGVKGDRRTGLDIYVGWSSPEAAVPLRTVAEWAAPAAGGAASMVVRDSAGRSFQWNRAQVAQR